MAATLRQYDVRRTPATVGAEVLRGRRGPATAGAVCSDHGRSGVLGRLPEVCSAGGRV
ncbi:hypothetical protein [Kribbella sp. NPDC050470]|uniref:hypothetical protein n=1 Tax=unclassified Kribbella TaxID=2644121 RepID=UPI0037956BDC